jgi:hypothetical protein
MADPDFRSLCVKHVALLEFAVGFLVCGPEFKEEAMNLLDRTRADLAQPAPEPPTDEELLRLYQVATPCYEVKEYKRELDFARAVLARWGQGDE